jgi:hypothetical protein
MPLRLSHTAASVLSVLLLATLGSAAQAQSTNAPASPATVTAQQALRASLPFEDERDREESQRGFIAAPDYRQILGAAGNVVWDMGRYDFLLDGTDYDSIHPSLQRQATLNMNYGLYEVVPDFIYQIRGYDLANMTLIRGERGWIETAKRALIGTRRIRETIADHPFTPRQCRLDRAINVVDAGSIEHERFRERPERRDLTAQQRLPDDLRLGRASRLARDEAADAALGQSLFETNSQR